MLVPALMAEGVAGVKGQSSEQSMAWPEAYLVSSAVRQFAPFLVRTFAPTRSRLDFCGTMLMPADPSWGCTRAFHHAQRNNTGIGGLYYAASAQTSGRTQAMRAENAQQCIGTKSDHDSCSRDARRLISYDILRAAKKWRDQRS